MGVFVRNRPQPQKSSGLDAELRSTISAFYQLAGNPIMRWRLTASFNQDTQFGKLTLKISELTCAHIWSRAEETVTCEQSVDSSGNLVNWTTPEQGPKTQRALQAILALRGEELLEIMKRDGWPEDQIKSMRSLKDFSLQTRNAPHMTGIRFGGQALEGVTAQNLTEVSGFKFSRGFFD